MIFLEKLNYNSEKDLWQAIWKQDVLTLRNKLKAIRNSLNQSVMSFEMCAMEIIKI